MDIPCLLLCLHNTEIRYHYGRVRRLRRPVSFIQNRNIAFYFIAFHLIADYLTVYACCFNITCHRNIISAMNHFRFYGSAHGHTVSAVNITTYGTAYGKITACVTPA